MNAKSITPSMTGISPIVAVPITTDSVSPVLAMVASTLSLYVPETSLKFK